MIYKARLLQKGRCWAWSSLGTTVIIAGILVIFLATIFASRPKEDGEERKQEENEEKEEEEDRGARVKGGGVIMIGPIPIIFGTDVKWTVMAIALAIVLIVLSLFLSAGL